MCLQTPCALLPPPLPQPYRRETPSAFTPFSSSRIRFLVPFSFGGPLLPFLLTSGAILGAS